MHPVDFAWQIHLLSEKPRRNGSICELINVAMGTVQVVVSGGKMGSRHLAFISLKVFHNCRAINACVSLSIYLFLSYLLVFVNLTTDNLCMNWIV